MEDTRPKVDRIESRNEDKCVHATGKQDTRNTNT